MTWRIAALAACVLGVAAPAAAQTIVIAGDPPPPPPPPPPPKPVPRESFVVLGAAVQSWISGADGVEELGRGADLSFTYLERTGDFPGGFDLSGLWLRGADATVYALSARLMMSPKLGRRVLVPFVGFGAAVGATRLEVDTSATKAMDVESGLALGPSAAMGLHGFLSDAVYWRGQVGFVGAGAGAMTADLGLGVVIE